MKNMLTAIQEKIMGFWRKLLHKAIKSKDLEKDQTGEAERQGRDKLEALDRRGKKRKKNTSVVWLQ